MTILKKSSTKTDLKARRMSRTLTMELEGTGKIKFEKRLVRRNTKHTSLKPFVEQASPDKVKKQDEKQEIISDTLSSYSKFSSVSRRGYRRRRVKIVKQDFDAIKKAYQVNADMFEGMNFDN